MVRVHPMQTRMFLLCGPREGPDSFRSVPRCVRPGSPPSHGVQEFDPHVFSLSPEGSGSPPPDPALGAFSPDALGPTSLGMSLRSHLCLSISGCCFCPVPLRRSAARVRWRPRHE